jgi:hypothetical protein
MKHFVKIKPGAVKSQQAKKCQACRGPVNIAKDYFILEAHWKIKRKGDKHTFCSVKCVRQWTKA